MHTHHTHTQVDSFYVTTPPIIDAVAAQVVLASWIESQAHSSPTGSLGPLE